jgi:hypothetical protein
MKKKGKKEFQSTPVGFDASEENRFPEFESVALDHSQTCYESIRKPIIVAYGIMYITWANPILIPYTVSLW